MMPKHTLRLPRISARHLLSCGHHRHIIVTILILPAAKCCLQLPSARRLWAFRRSHRSRDDEECFGDTSVQPKMRETKHTTLRCTPVSSARSFDLFFNHNFVYTAGFVLANAE